MLVKIKKMGQKPYSMLKKEYEFGAMLTQKLESD
jgi:hypothetical protein